MTKQKNETGIEKVEGNTITINDPEKFKKHLKKVTDMIVDRKPVKELYNFQYIFSDDELKDKGKQLARANEERNTLEDQKKSIVSDFKAKIDSKSAEINILASHVTNGYEWLNKSCEVIFDWDKGKKHYMYEGVQVGTEKIQPHEYQVELDLAAEQNRKETKED